MFRVAVCDDNSVFLRDFEKDLEDILHKHNIEFTIDSFSSVTEFIQEIENGVPFQLLFMDIGFDNSSHDGLYGADFIRTCLSESNVDIVFISGQPRYAMHLFDYQPLNFLIKPINRTKLESTIQKSLHKWSCNKHVFHFISNRKEISIETEQIIYIESFGRKKLLHCISEKTYPINEPFSDILNQLERYHFLSPHKSYIINYQRVAVWYKNKIIMENGASIPIGRSQIKKVQEIQFKHHFD